MYVCMYVCMYVSSRENYSVLSPFSPLLRKSNLKINLVTNIFSYFQSFDIRFCRHISDQISFFMILKKTSELFQVSCYSKFELLIFGLF